MGSETKEKDTYKYHLKVGKKVVHKDICTDWVSREVFHQEEFPGSKIKLIGRRTTREAALKWVHRGGRRGYRFKGRQGVMGERAKIYEEVIDKLKAGIHYMWGAIHHSYDP